MTIDIVPLTPHIGAEIRGVDLAEELDGETVWKCAQQSYVDGQLRDREQ